MALLLREDKREALLPPAAPAAAPAAADVDYSSVERCALDGAAPVCPASTAGHARGDRPVGGEGRPAAGDARRCAV